jgi:hypothetical protein
LLVPADVRAGVAEDLTLRILGEEGEHGLAALTASGNVVLLNEGIVSEVGDRVEVEVEGLAVDQLLLA